MNDQQRLQLQNMIRENQTEDQTELIRSLKHSSIIRGEVEKLIAVREKYAGDDTKIHEQGALEATFLFTYYTDIFNKVRKNEISTTLLGTFLDILQQIEDGELDQHEGSFRVGTVLKEMYVDSALKKADKLNQNEETKTPPQTAQVQMSWKEYKANQEKKNA